MDDADWDSGFTHSVGVYLNGDAIPGRDERGQPITDQSMLLLLNAHYEPIDWTLPSEWETHWQVAIDTSDTIPEGTEIDPHAPLPTSGRSVLVLASTTNDAVAK